MRENRHGSENLFETELNLKLMNKHLTSKSAANISSDSVNISGAEGFFGLVPAEKMTNSNDGVQRHCI